MQSSKSQIIHGIAFGSLGLALFLSISMVSMAFSYAQLPVNQLDEVENNVSSKRQTNISSLHTLEEKIEDRLEKAATILEFASQLPELRTTSFSNMINASIHGIPEHADPEKREIARFIVSEYPEDFVSLLFMLPNGTVYIQEPFERQLNLSASNLSFRDYYKGVINTNDAFLSNVIVSGSTGLRQAPLAVPVFSDNNKTSLVGILAGGLNFETFGKIIQSSHLDEKERLLLVDQRGVKIADSDTQLSYQNESFSYLHGFNNAINGESGSIIETVNGTEMVVSYYPVDAVSNRWVIISLQPSIRGGSESNSTATSLAKLAENADDEEIIIQNTSMSRPAPLRHPGQPSHEVVFALPLRQDEKVYSGTVTFTASKPIEVEVLHTYAPPQEIDSDHGEPYHALLPGNNSIAITHLRDLVDKSLEVNATQISSGTIDFVGNALVFHKTNGEPFTVTYSIEYKVKDLTDDASIK